jgi:hypothetical protein
MHSVILAREFDVPVSVILALIVMSCHLTKVGSKGVEIALILSPFVAVQE